MNINKESRIYFIIGGILLSIFCILLLVPKTKKEQGTPSPTTFPSPTSYAVSSTKKDNIITPTLIPARDFTGVKEEELSTEASSLIIQKQNLKKKIPLQGNYFNITFDYNEDKFIVELKEPKTDTQTKFEQWLKQSYPTIPIDRFIFK